MIIGSIHGKRDRKGRGRLKKHCCVKGAFVLLGLKHTGIEGNCMVRMPYPVSKKDYRNMFMKAVVS